MRKWGFFLLILGLIALMGWFWRVDRYFNALLSIHELPRPLWRQAYLQMGQVEGGERGILARVTGAGVWVWRGWRVDYIQVDQDTVYSYWWACDELPSIEQLRENGGRQIGREVTTNLVQWRERVQPGKVVDVYLASDREDSVAREIYGYDWRLYLPLPATLEIQCKK
jgi:hypothetical protein